MRFNRGYSLDQIRFLMRHRSQQTTERHYLEPNRSQVIGVQVHATLSNNLTQTLTDTVEPKLLSEEIANLKSLLNEI